MATVAPNEYAAFLRERAQSFGSEPRQSVWRCVEHLISLFVNVIEGATSRRQHGKKEQQISAQEARDFMSKRHAGCRITKRRSATAHWLAGKLAHAHERLLDSLGRVGIFRALSASQLELLRDTMVQSVHAKGEFVFDQGDEGDVLYVILDGAASCLHTVFHDTEMKFGMESKIAALGPGAFFGERALLYHEKRFAAVRADDRLHTMCISRAKFEAIVGPLADVVSRAYQGSPNDFVPYS